jgi:CDP-4-dehydro-6-deoxyglucose reductase
MKPIKFKSEIHEIKQLTSDAKLFKFTIPEGFSFEPGQYVSMILDKEGERIRRPYSIASVPNKDYFELCIKIMPESISSKVVDSLKVGDKVNFIGPLGSFKVNSGSKDIVFVSTGIGITPFRSMINYLLKNGFDKKITLIEGYKYQDDVLFDDEFKDLEEKYDNFDYYKILSREGDEKGHVQELVEENIDKLKSADFYLCGLKEIVNSMKELLLEKGILKEDIYFEDY